jgi:hypothetical protein
MPWELTGNGNIGQGFLGTTDQEPLSIRTNGNEALRIDPSGNVGVGTQNPVTKVEIVGNWNGQEGTLRLTGDKPTVKFVGGAVTGNHSWILHLGSDGPGDLEFFKQGPTPTDWVNVMTLHHRSTAPSGRVEVVGDWDGTEGALRLTGDKPTVKLAGGPIAGNQSWIIHVGSDGPGSLEFFKQGASPTSWDNVMTLSPSGNVGVGTPNPTGGQLHVEGTGVAVFGVSQNGEGLHGETNSLGVAGIAGFSLNTSGTGAAVYGESRNQGPGVFGVSQNGEGLHGETNSLGVAGIAGFSLNTSGTGAAVYGESRNRGPGVMGFSNTGLGGTGDAGLFVGNVTINGNLTMGSGGDVFLSDFAEDFDIADAEAEPGTVMAIEQDGTLRPSNHPYDKRVAGVVSGAGDYRPAIVLDKQAQTGNRRPIALVGKVYCKVDAGYSPIEVGDLLTTSATPGYAMKADNPLRAFGAVIGKALRPVTAGQDLIPILIALQ